MDSCLQILLTRSVPISQHKDTVIENEVSPAKEWNSKSERHIIMLPNFGLPAYLAEVGI